jgi:putative ABC transport system permease protein
LGFSYPRAEFIATSGTLGPREILGEAGNDGTQPRDTEVFLQFLIESVTLSVVGAGIGLAGGVGLVKVIARFFPAGLPVSLFGTTVSVGFAISIGLLAGLYPSISASRLEPVEALRA